MTTTRAMVLAAIGAVAVACTAARMAGPPGGGSYGESMTAARPVQAEPVPAMPATATSGESRVDFQSQIRPLLETGCAPCHFEGGKMYEPLPFDDPATIRLLGADKLFTRVKDEQQRALIRAFLAQPA